MLFKDRRQAGELLAQKLQIYRCRSPLILAVPRGGVVVAEPILDQLGGKLDLLITRKIGAPWQPELAIGAVAGDGLIMLNERLVEQMGVPKRYIDQAAAEEQRETRRRLERYRGKRPLPEVDGSLVILVDDGVATGFTLLAALKALRRQQPRELVLAVPVGPPDTFARLRPEVDALFYLEAPPDFAAVGQFYANFDQVDDSTVVSILSRAWAREDG